MIGLHKNDANWFSGNTLWQWTMTMIAWWRQWPYGTINSSVVSRGFQRVSDSIKFGRDRLFRLVVTFKSSLSQSVDFSRSCWLLFDAWWREDNMMCARESSIGAIDRGTWTLCRLPAMNLLRFFGEEERRLIVHSYSMIICTAIGVFCDVKPMPCACCQLPLSFSSSRLK